MVVTVVFGLSMGWGVGRTLPDLRPAVVTYLAGMIIGAVVWIGGLGPSPNLSGGSLLLGCTAALAASARALAGPGP